MRFRLTMVALAVLILLTAPTLGGSLFQTRQFPAQPPPPEDEQRILLEKEQAKKANLERQAQLRRDADQLLKLATELKQYVDKSNENVLSVEVIKKAAEIERLARSVKDKMKAN